MNTAAKSVSRVPHPSAPGPTGIYTAPEGTGHAVLGRTLPSLLDEACRNNPNERAFNQFREGVWQPLSTADFRVQSEALALGLTDLGLRRGDRVAFFTHSDLSFCLLDMACAVAGLVSVPIYLTHAPEAIRFILDETQAKALAVSDGALLADIEPLLGDVKGLESLLIHDTENAPLTAKLPLLSYADLQERGERVRRERPDAVKALRADLQPDNLATIIYTSGTTGTPKGVMLSHENLSSNAVAAFSGIHDLKRGEEVALSFLPLTHVFARAIQYGYMAWGVAVYFTTPERVGEHLRDVEPTVFATVPRVLEKVYERILTAGNALSGTKKRLFDWALELARRYRVGEIPKSLYALQLRAADRLVLARWRAALGGEMRLVIVGGAALRPELVHLFGAVGIDVLQGYGLTETSPIIAYNRPEANRAGTVGQVLAGAEVKLSEEGEILTRGPHVMKGYYNNPEETNKVIDEAGWFHTGDLGEVSEDGFLSITGRVKNLFKLSTGKYVMPQPLEGVLETDDLIETALVVGEGEKYTGALLFLSQDQLRSFAKRLELAGEMADWLGSDALQTHLKEVLGRANRSLPHWSHIKRAALIAESLTLENGLLTPTLKVKRQEVVKRYEAQLDALFGHGGAPSETSSAQDSEGHSGKVLPASAIINVEMQKSVQA